MRETSEPRIENIGYLIHDIGRLMRNAFDERVKELGLTRSRWRVLVHLLRQDGLGQSELADELNIGKASLVSLLDGLEKQGWVRRDGDASDRRAKRVYLTDKVEPILSFMNEVGAKLLRESLDGLSSAERERLMGTLNHVKSNLLDMGGVSSKTTATDKSGNEH